MRQITVLVVPADDPPRLEAIDATVENMRECIGNGWLEALSGYTVDNGEWWAYCDEEGKLKHLPINPVANYLASKAGRLSSDVLAGPVVFFGSDDSGDEQDVPAWLVDIVRPLMDGAA